MPDERHPASWFRSAEGRRYFLALGGIIVIKIVLLLALFYCFIAPQPRPDSSPEALRRHVLDPDSDLPKGPAHGR
jgi:hypothetical protein